MSKNSARNLVPADEQAARAPLTLVADSTEQGVGASFQGDDKARAKTLLQTLMFQRDLYPEFARHLDPAINALGVEAKRTPQSDRSCVLLTLENDFDGATFEDLEDETHLSPEHLARALCELLRLRLVDCRPTGRRAGTRIDPHLLGCVEAAIECGAFFGARLDKRIEYMFTLARNPAGSSYSAPARSHSSAEAMTRSLGD